MPDAFQANAIVPDDALIFCPKGIAGNRFQIMNVKLGCLSVVIFKSLRKSLCLFENETG